MATSSAAVVAVADGAMVATDGGMNSIDLVGDGDSAVESVDTRGAKTGWPAKSPLLVVVVTGSSTYMIAAASAITTSAAAIASTVGASCFWDRLRERSATTPFPLQNWARFDWSLHHRPAAGSRRSPVV
jgi:hypothetical protein